MSSGAAIKSWLLVASIGAVEALKDQGVARWNRPLKAIHNHAKSKIVSSCNKAVGGGGGGGDRSVRSLIVGAELGGGKCRLKRTKVETMKKVMEVNCWGPNSVRF